MASIRRVKCPTCGAPVAFDQSSPFRPFCSERCRTTDLGDWAAERHRIGGNSLDDAPDPGSDHASESNSGSTPES